MLMCVESHLFFQPLQVDLVGEVQGPPRKPAVCRKGPTGASGLKGHFPVKKLCGGHLCPVNVDIFWMY